MSCVANGVPKGPGYGTRRVPEDLIKTMEPRFKERTLYQDSQVTEFGTTVNVQIWGGWVKVPERVTRDLICIWDQNSEESNRAFGSGGYIPEI